MDMTSSSDWNFIECRNPACRLRFPLDLALYNGSHCPRCGSETRPCGQRLPQNADLPAASKSTAGRRLFGLLDNLRSAQNVGAIFRSADGAGLAGLYLCGITPTPDDTKAVSRTALGAEKRLHWQQANNAVDLAQDLLAAGIKLLVLEPAETALNLFTWQIPEDWSALALVVGNEIAGTDPQLLRLASQTLCLPMAGIKGSLNVASAFSIAAYQLQFGQASKADL